MIDRPRLEARACECYRGMKTEFGRLLAKIPAVSRPNARTAGSYVPVPGGGARAHIEAVPA